MRRCYDAPSENAEPALTRPWLLMDYPVYMFGAVEATLTYLWMKAKKEKDQGKIFCDADCLPSILLSLSVALSSTTQECDQARYFRVYTGMFTPP